MSDPGVWGRWTLIPTNLDAILVANNYFAVHADLGDQVEFGVRIGMPVLHLSFRRQDRSKATEIGWREKQRMKNELCGSNTEAVELFPAESRMVDGSDQYHLWVSPPGMTWAVGYHQERSVSWEGEPLPELGGTQTLPDKQYLEATRVNRGRLHTFFPSWAEWTDDEGNQDG